MIEIDDVTKRDGSTVAVDRLSVEVRPGEVTIDGRRCQRQPGWSR